MGLESAKGGGGFDVRTGREPDRHGDGSGLPLQRDTAALRPDDPESVVRELHARLLRSAHVRLVDNRVSRRHAQIEIVAGRCVLNDLASTNGTTVNGAPVSQQVLHDGDVIGIGGVELRFHLTEH